MEEAQVRMVVNNLVLLLVVVVLFVRAPRSLAIVVSANLVVGFVYWRAWRAAKYTPFCPKCGGYMTGGICPRCK